MLCAYPFADAAIAFDQSHIWVVLERLANHGYGESTTVTATSVGLAALNHSSRHGALVRRLGIFLSRRSAIDPASCQYVFLTPIGRFSLRVLLQLSGIQALNSMHLEVVSNHAHKTIS